MPTGSVQKMNLFQLLRIENLHRLPRVYKNPIFSECYHFNAFILYINIFGKQVFLHPQRTHSANTQKQRAAEASR